MSETSTIPCSACKEEAGEELTFGLTFERHSGSTFRVSLCRECTAAVLDLLVLIRDTTSNPTHARYF